MEYIAGDDVGSMLTSEGHRFSVEQILKWADQLLDALDYLHNQENQVFTAILSRRISRSHRAEIGRAHV